MTRSVLPLVLVLSGCMASAQAEIQRFLGKATTAAGSNKYAFLKFAAEPGPVVNDPAGPAGTRPDPGPRFRP